MKRKFYLILLVILVFFAILLVFLGNYKNDSSINVKNPNSIGNDTNNIIQNINISIQDDYIYYSSLDGLFKTRIGSNENIKLDDGDIRNVNVIGKWIYYVKAKNENNNSGIITHLDLYRIMINGDQKKVIIKDAYNVNVMDNKIYYISGYGVTGNYNTDENINSLNMSDLNGNNKQTIIEKDVDSMIVYGNYIYYASDAKLFVYDIDKKKNELLSDKIGLPYIVNDKNVVFYDKKLKQIKELNFNTKEIKVIVNDVINLNSLYINNDILYYTDSNTRLFAYDLNKNQTNEIDKDFGIVLFYYDKLYSLSKDNEIKMIRNNK